MIDRKWCRQIAAAHTRAGREDHFGFLQMKIGVREAVQTTGVIVVQVRDDHRINVSGHRACAQQGRSRVSDDRAIAARALAGVITGIDHNLALPVHQQPDKIVHTVRGGGVVITKKTVSACPGVTISVFDRMDFP